ncbi:MAG: DUF6804 family protein [Candidatus Eiseniibacteriota bacterium]
MAKGKEGASGGWSVLRFAAWAVGVLALASAFVPLERRLTLSLDWVLCVFSVLMAGVAAGQRRRAAFAAYAAAAILVNPLVPFHFPPQVWRLVYAATGIWLIADQLAGLF